MSRVGISTIAALANRTFSSVLRVRALYFVMMKYQAFIVMMEAFCIVEQMLQAICSVVSVLMVVCAVEVAVVCKAFGVEARRGKRAG